MKQAGEQFELDWLRQWARYSPRADALRDSETGEGYTYASLYFLSCHLAAHLRANFGITKGSRIAVLATNELEHLPLFFAAQRLGATLVPINFRLAAREIAHILSDSAPELLIFQEQFAPLVKSIGARAAVVETWSFDGANGLTEYIQSATTPANAGVPSVRPPTWAIEFTGDVESACLILYTSGTTGAPKGAIITNKMLHWNSVNTQLRLNLSQNDRTIAFAPFFHTGGWNVLLTPYLHRGATTIFMHKFDAGRVLELCEREKVTMFFGVPTMLDMMARTPQFETADLSSVRFSIVGGEPMPIELIKTWGAKGVPIRQGFGLTEFGPNVFSLNEEDALRKIGSIGFPNFYIQTKIVDPDEGESRQNEHREVAPGEIGELLLKGPVCTPGYWNNPKATGETIRDGWFHTGDLVRQDSEGYFYVAGRKKDMYISGGENVYPVEVERFLSTHPAIREVAIIGVPDAKWGEVGQAHVVLVGGARVIAFDVLSYCEGNLARYKIPKHVVFVSELPKSDSGKILKRQLRSATSASAAAAPNAATAPSTATTRASLGRISPTSQIETGSEQNSAPEFPLTISAFGDSTRVQPGDRV